MYTLGMKVHGDFIPSEELLKKAEEMRKKYLADAEHAASIDQRFGAIEEKRKAAGIERPEDVGKEFMNSLKKEGLGYQPAQQKDGKEEDKPAPTNDGKDSKEGDDKPAPTMMVKTAKKKTPLLQLPLLQIMDKKPFSSRDVFSCPNMWKVNSKKLSNSRKLLWFR